VKRKGGKKHCFTSGAEKGKYLDGERSWYTSREEKKGRTKRFYRHGKKDRKRAYGSNVV